MDNSMRQLALVTLGAQSQSAMHIFKLRVAHPLLHLFKCNEKSKSIPYILRCIAALSGTSFNAQRTTNNTCMVHWYLQW